MISYTEAVEIIGRHLGKRPTEDFGLGDKRRVGIQLDIGRYPSRNSLERTARQIRSHVQRHCPGCWLDGRWDWSFAIMAEGGIRVYAGVDDVQD